MGTVRDLVGRRFGNLSVVRFAGLSKYRKSMWECACSCGGRSVALGNNLLRGKTRSCGCGQHVTHGFTHHPAFDTWRRMMARCYDSRNSNFPGWGGRGIEVCSKWHDFLAFNADMGAPPFKGASIERIDNEGPYSPGNCKWISHRDQPKNTRATIWVEYKGRRIKMMQLAAILGVKPDTLRKRIRRGAPFDGGSHG